MIYNKYTNTIKKLIILEKIDLQFLEKQANMHDLSCNLLINKIIKSYIKNCKEKIKNL